MKTLQKFIQVNLKYGEETSLDTVFKDAETIEIISIMKDYARYVAKHALENASENIESENCYRYSSERNVVDSVAESVSNIKNIPNLD